MERLDNVVCIVEMVKAVLAVRNAGQPPLPHHLLREDFKAETQRGDVTKITVLVSPGSNTDPFDS